MCIQNIPAYSHCWKFYFLKQTGGAYARVSYTQRIPTKISICHFKEWRLFFEAVKVPGGKTNTASVSFIAAGVVFTKNWKIRGTEMLGGDLLRR